MTSSSLLLVVLVGWPTLCIKELSFDSILLDSNFTTLVPLSLYVRACVCVCETTNWNAFIMYTCDDSGLTKPRKIGKGVYVLALLQQVA
jgi:hypothetical protein